MRRKLGIGLTAVSLAVMMLLSGFVSAAEKSEGTQPMKCGSCCCKSSCMGN
ncbi:MAG TPA: hypothetical protein PKN80_01105 [bacterium]|nr:hypothetical protein [bacterium]HNS48904.1 hypothetical protein [bacterium]